MNPLAALDGFELILASKSPRRQQLLKDLGVNFKVETREVDESYPANLQREQVPMHIALKKAEAFKDLIHSDHVLLITADTIVCLHGLLIGKPENYDDAVRILRLLSGKVHEVFTSVCIISRSRKEIFTVRSEVYFKKLTIDEIYFYLRQHPVYDKAGAYGIQDWIGLIAIEKINGSFHNVMGLPVKELYEHLLRFAHPAV